MKSSFARRLEAPASALFVLLLVALTFMQLSGPRVEAAGRTHQFISGLDVPGDHQVLQSWHSPGNSLDLILPSGSTAGTGVRTWSYHVTGGYQAFAGLETYQRTPTTYCTGVFLNLWGDTGSGWVDSPQEIAYVHLTNIISYTPGTGYYLSASGFTGLWIGQIDTLANQQALGCAYSGSEHLH